MWSVCLLTRCWILLARAYGLDQLPDPCLDLSDRKRLL